MEQLLSEGRPESRVVRSTENDIAQQEAESFLFTMAMKRKQGARTPQDVGRERGARQLLDAKMLAELDRLVEKSDQEYKQCQNTIALARGFQNGSRGKFNQTLMNMDVAEVYSFPRTTLIAK